MDVVCARVFGPGERGANQGDIASAIEHLSMVREADLVNLSLGAVHRSEIEHDAIVEALETGTLCLCAAANSAGPVQYPAAFEEAVAVSALGLQGWGPDGTLSASRCPVEKDRYGNEACIWQISAASGMRSIARPLVSGLSRRCRSTSAFPRPTR